MEKGLTINILIHLLFDTKILFVKIYHKYTLAKYEKTFKYIKCTKPFIITLFGKTKYYKHPKSIGKTSQFWHMHTIPVKRNAGYSIHYVMLGKKRHSGEEDVQWYNCVNTCILALHPVWQQNRTEGKYAR